MDEIVRQAMKLDIGQLLVMAAMMLFLYNRIGARFQLIDARLDKMDSRLDKMQETITDIDRRLCRLEGAFHSKDCCMLKAEAQSRKAE